MEINTQESTTIQLRELLEIWSHCNQRPKWSSFGKLWLNILVTISGEVEVLISRSSEHSPIMWTQSSQKLLKDLLVLKLIFSLKDRRERIFITLSLFLLWTQSCNIISSDIQEKKKFLQLRVNIQFIKRDSEQSMPIQFQLLPQLVLVKMSLLMLSIPSSWQFKISLSSTKTSILHLVSVM